MPLYCQQTDKNHQEWINEVIKTLAVYRSYNTPCHMPYRWGQSFPLYTIPMGTYSPSVHNTHGDKPSLCTQYPWGQTLPLYTIPMLINSPSVHHTYGDKLSLCTSYPWGHILPLYTIPMGTNSPSVHHTYWDKPSLCTPYLC